MDFTAIVCTYNRRANLAGCLEHLARQQGVEGLAWEILVVDNNSSDGTADEVQALARRLPVPVRCVREAEQGLNYARNTGVRQSQGRWFAFVDDDIHVSAGWLAALVETFRREDADAVGGRIHLDPTIQLPEWIGAHPELKGFLGHQDFGEEPFRMDGQAKYPYGGNMAFDRRVIERIGYFNPLLGRKGAGTRRAELFKGAETDYFHRLAARGDARIFYAPGAIVYHRVMPFQLTKKYFRTIHFNAGLQKALHGPSSPARRLLGIPRFLFGQILGSVGRYLAELCRRGPDAAFRQQMTVGYHLGMAIGYARRNQ